MSVSSVAVLHKALTSSKAATAQGASLIVNEAVYLLLIPSLFIAAPELRGTEFNFESVWRLSKPTT